LAVALLGPFEMLGGPVNSTRERPVLMVITARWRTNNACCPHSKKPRGLYTARLQQRLPIARFRRLFHQWTKPGMVPPTLQQYKQSPQVRARSEEAEGG